MVELALAEAAAACHARIVGAGSLLLRGASLDSRSVPAGGLFVAVRGEKSDGHDFVAAAFDQGASAALVSRELPVPPGRALLVVAEVPAALLDLARAIRLREKWQVVAVTGSAGKTTTKEMTATILSGFRKTGRSPGNRNNTLGLPEAILCAEKGLELYVAECGMSFAGELALLASALRPDLVIYTNVAPAHLQNFGSVDEIEWAKEELIAGAGPKAVVIANADDPRASAIAKRHPGRRVDYGIDSPAEVRATGIRALEDSVQFLLVTPQGSAPAEIPMPGRHNVSNFLAAAAAGSVLGMSPEAIADRARIVRPARHRGERHRLPNGALVVDESYNSNPRALCATAESFGEQPAPGGGRRIGILGEMRELGAESESLHRETGRRIARYFDEIVAVGGADARSLVEGAREGGLSSRATRLLPTPESAAASVLEKLMPTDRILLKGSRGVGLERALPALGIKTDIADAGLPGPRS